MFKKSICGSSAADCSKNQELIQQLITRLLTESENEATQKGWCDTEIGKARSCVAALTLADAIATKAQQTGLEALQTACDRHCRLDGK